MEAGFNDSFMWGKSFEALKIILNCYSILMAELWNCLNSSYGIAEHRILAVYLRLGEPLFVNGTESVSGNGNQQ